MRGGGQRGVGCRCILSQSPYLQHMDRKQIREVKALVRAHTAESSERR